MNKKDVAYIGCLACAILVVIISVAKLWLDQLDTASKVLITLVCLLGLGCFVRDGLSK